MILKCLKRSFAVIINPFITLGIPEDASLEDAKKAYKALVLKYHPDVSKEDHSEKFREITEAYGLAKKRIESRENLAIPKEDGFVSKRPKYDGKVGSVIRDDKVREYINFTPLDIKIVDKDRLGINYKPFFDDSDSVHPKTGTIMILAISSLVTMLYSAFVISSRKRDEDLNIMIHEKLKRTYSDSEEDKETLHPALLAATMDSEYKAYVEQSKLKKSFSSYKTLVKAPLVLDRFDAKKFDQTEPAREYLKRDYSQT